MPRHDNNPFDDPDIGEILQHVLEKLSELPSVIGKLGEIVSKAVSSFTPLVSAINALLAAGTAAVAAPIVEAAKHPVVEETPKSAQTNELGDMLIVVMQRLTISIVRLTTLIERILLAAMSGRFPSSGGTTALPPAGGGSSPRGGPPTLPTPTPTPPTPTPTPTPPTPTPTPTPPTPTPTPPGPSPAPDGAIDVAGPLAGLAAVGAVAAAAIGALAAVVNIAQQEFRNLEEKVRLFNPGVIVMFHQALDNLGATIGSAFVPMFQVATEVVRRWSAVLAPIMAGLAPVVKQISELFGNIMVPYLASMGKVLQGLIPSIVLVAEVFGMVFQIVAFQFSIIASIVKYVGAWIGILKDISGIGIVIKVVTKLFEALSKVMEVFGVVLDLISTALRSTLDAAMSLIYGTDLLQKAMDALTIAVQWVIRNLYVLATYMAKFVGLDGAVDALIAQVEGKANDQTSTAAQSPQIKGLEQLSKDIALAAAAAGGAAGGANIRNEAEFWKKTLEEMRAAKANGISVKELLQKILDAILGKGGGAAPAQPAPPPGGGGVGGGGLPGWLGPQTPIGDWLFGKRNPV